jgi:hypothetical protein
MPLSKEGSHFAVYFVDYGNQALVTELKALPEDLIKVPHLSYPCRLPVKPADSVAFTVEANTRMETLAFEESLIAKIYCKDENAVLVSDLLIGGKSITEVLETENHVKSLLCEAYICFVTSPTSFYINLKKEEATLHKMEAQLQTADQFETLDKVELDALCVAKFIDDKLWYRAKVVDITDTTTTIQFIDFGNSAVATEFRVMPEDMINIPALARHCALKSPPTRDEEIKKFMEMASDITTLFKILMPPEDTADPMEVVLLKDDKDVIESHFKLQYPVKKHQEIEPTKSVEISQIPETPFEIFIVDESIEQPGKINYENVPSVSVIEDPNKNVSLNKRTTRYKDATNNEKEQADSPLFERPTLFEDNPPDSSSGPIEQEEVRDVSLSDYTTRDEDNESCEPEEENEVSKDALLNECITILVDGVESCGDPEEEEIQVSDSEKTLVFDPLGSDVGEEDTDSCQEYPDSIMDPIAISSENSVDDVIEVDEVKEDMEVCESTTKRLINLVVDAVDTSERDKEEHHGLAVSVHIEHKENEEVHPTEKYKHMYQQLEEMYGSDVPESSNDNTSTSDP